jgi:methionyl-tRNA synthetase
LCEKCGRVPDQILDPKCAICGRPPVKKESKHYFFRLSSLEEKLKEWLLSNQNLQSDVKNYVINWINEGLQDWDITRDLSWGVPIPLPEAKGKVFYGWFDNHLCYISSLAKFENDRGGNGKKLWTLSTTTTSSCRQYVLASIQNTSFQTISLQGATLCCKTKRYQRVETGILG